MPSEKSKEGPLSRIISARVDARRIAILDYLHKHNGRAGRVELWEVFGGDTVINHNALEGLQDKRLIRFDHNADCVQVLLMRKPSG